MQVELEALAKWTVHFQKELEKATSGAKASAIAISSLESVLELMAQNVNPRVGGVVHSYTGNYGKHGALTSFLRNFTKTAAPRAFSVSDLATAAAIYFEIEIASSKFRDELRDTVKNRVYSLFLHIHQLLKFRNLLYLD